MTVIYRWWSLAGLGLLWMPTTAAALPPVLAAAEPAATSAVTQPGDQVSDLAALLPENTAFALALNTDPAVWQTLTQFELFAKLADLMGTAPNPGGLPFLPSGLDYRQIQPWIGRSALLAVLPVPSPGTVTFSERTLLIAPVAAENFEVQPLLAEIAALRGSQPEAFTYKGTPVWLWPTEDISDSASEQASSPGIRPERSVSMPLRSLLPEPPLLPPAADSLGVTRPGLAVVQAGNYLAFADNLTVLQLWLEYQYPGGPLLSENAAFLRTNQEPAAESAIALLYGDVGELSKFSFADTFDPASLGIPVPDTGLREQAAAVRFLEDMTFDTLVYPQAEGLRLQARLYRNQFLPSFPVPSSGSEGESILSRVPAPTYLLGSGQDLAGLWREAAAALSLNELTRGFLETARSVVSFALGLNLDDDLLGWMDGEYTLFFFPSRTGLLNSVLPGLQVEVAVMFETSNRPAAETALAALDRLVGAAVSRVTINQQPAVSWNFDLDGAAPTESVLSHGWVADDTLVLATGVGAMANLLDPPAFESLTEHSTFIDATASLLSENYGYFYVNAGATLSMVYSALALTPTDPDIQLVKSFLGTVSSFTATTSSTPDYVQADLLLGLAAANAREPLALEIP
ncbi:MAG: DUF3352 domain-containing protein [Leptolyngbya sp. SIO4C1]|nr:DUF3352 domain-containing protein [Leptolyngbya sp. SIO4C1]